jgi:hypothetical protein
MDTLNFTQRAAAEYLTSEGIPMTESQLSLIGKFGGGPEYTRFGRQKVFTIGALDRWIRKFREEQSARDGTAPGGTRHQTEGR